MNDTEADARRLLAAAAEDKPPGIDLLAGFDAARRRDRTRRLRGRAVLSAGVAMAAAVVTALTLTVGSAPPALATATTALTRTLTQSYHLTEQDNYRYIWNGRIRNHYHLTCMSEADPARKLEATSCSNGPGPLEVGGYTYIYIDHPADHPGRHWERIPTRLVGQLPNVDSFTAATPQQMLSEIEKADKVTVAGPASGPGWTGTRYAFSGSPASWITISGTLDVDGRGRARALVLTTRFTSDTDVMLLTQVLTFSDFGARITVTPPPATQTFDLP